MQDAHIFSPGDFEATPHQVLDPSGELVGEMHLTIDEVRDLYSAMVEARAYDRKASALQLQGRLATYSPFLGQEACQIGSVACLESIDWLVATYRDAAAMWLHGYTWQALFLGRTGDERGGSPPEAVQVLPPSITVGAHMLHAVGLSWASRLRGDGGIALTLFGDGATSEGEFHEGMNLAGVLDAPTVFLCQNNHYAISAHRSIQTRSETIAQKAIAYGMPGYLVDGNDVVAVHAVTARAVERARAGQGPSLIEALTYRMAPHTTADDPTRYREAGEEELWRARDPLERVRVYLSRNGAWDEGWQAELDEQARATIEEAVEAAEGLPPLDPEDFFGATVAELDPVLARQAAAAKHRSGSA